MRNKLLRLFAIIILITLVFTNLSHADRNVIVVGGNEELIKEGKFKGCDMLPGGIIQIQRKNLLRNSSFEWDYKVGRRGTMDGMAFSWGLWGRGNAYGLYKDSSVPNLVREHVHGTRSQQIRLKAVGKEMLNVIQDVQGLIPDLPYTFSVYVKTDAPEQVEASVSINFISNGRWYAAKSSSWQSPTDFTRLHASGTAPAKVTRARCTILFRPKANNAVATVWIDAAQFEQSDKPSDYTPCYATDLGEYLSPPISLLERGDPYKLSWIAAQPSGTDIRFQLRSAATKAALTTATWHGPKNAAVYATAIGIGLNLLDNPSLEKQVGKGKSPAATRTIGYGDNDRTFAVVSDAHTGAKALRVTITNYKGGNGRWEIWKDGPFEKNAMYVFSIWHKENSTSTPISMSIAIREPDGKMRWGRFSQTKSASTTWKRDTIYFRKPAKEVGRLNLELNLNGVGSTITDDYSLRRAGGAEEWAVNPIHRGARWIQFRAILTTSDPSLSPKLYRTEILCGPSVPEIRWLNVLRDDGRKQRYAFSPGQTALFRPQILDFTGASNIVRVNLTLLDPGGNARLETEMSREERVSREEVYFTARYTFPKDAPLGEWRAIVNVVNQVGQMCREMVVLKVRHPYRTAPRRMTIGALVTNYGFSHYKGEALERLIEQYRRAKGLEIWKTAVNWQKLEPTPGAFNTEMIAGLKRFIAAAHDAGSTAQIGIQQQLFPEWVNNGDWDNANRYNYSPTTRLAATWRHLADVLKDCPGLDSYLLINEENAIRDADAYLRSMAKVQSAVRDVDTNPEHRVTIRPNTRDPYLRTRIASDGAQDYDYGSGGYPTSASWYFKEYANPVSQTACLRMATFHVSPFVFGGPGGIGEVGFFVRKSNDSFGDEERLAGFERAMRIAYEMGMDEFHLWGGTFSFDKLEVYYPKLLAFRDELLQTPRPERLDVQLVLDTGDPLFVSLPKHSSRLDMSKQPFAPLFRYLDGKGYVWYYTTPEAAVIQDVSTQATIKLSELKGKSPTEQELLLARILKDVKPSGTPMPWPENED